MVIEQDVPDIPGRQVHLADGFLDLPGFRMAAHPPQCCFQSEPREEQPVHHDVVDVPGGDAAVTLRRKRDHLRRIACPPGRGIVRWPYTRLVQFRYRPVAGHDW
jgi:hypothetical protein